MLNIQTILKSTKGTLLQDQGRTTVTSVCIDSRAIKKGCLFIAIKGDRFDGHKFIEQAIAKGAAAVICSRRIKLKKPATLIQVKDTTKALGEVARAYRQQFDIPVIAITGSTGKTTTKDLISCVLKSKFHVLKNEKTQNNHIGVPLTLLKLNKKHEVAVLEIGTNQPGDIAWGAYIAQPTVAVFTNIGESHLERLKTPSGVFREKIQLIKSMDKKGKVIFNLDDPFLAKLTKKKLTQSKIAYSVRKRSKFQASQISHQGLKSSSFKLAGKNFKIQSPAAHNITNAIGAICCGHLFGISYNNINKSLSKFRFGQGRQAIKRVGQYWIIDDTYNANPVSYRSAIHTLETLNIRGRKILVCGDMLELGIRAREFHGSIGHKIANSSIDFVVSIGSLSKEITRSIKASTNDIATFHATSLGKAHQKIKQYARPGDVLLVKGSRGMKMEKTIQYLNNHFK